MDNRATNCVRERNDVLVKTLRGTVGTTSATRSATPGWRDPRLWIGVLIVAASVVAGVRVVGGADEMASVWTVSQDVGIGAELDPSLLEARSVRFEDAEDLTHYLSVDEPLPAESDLTRGLGTGELVPAAALGSVSQTGVVQVPIRVPGDGVPPSVGVGSTVDVYVSDESQARRPAVLLLDEVAVNAAPGVVDEFGPGGTRQLVLAVPADVGEELTLLIAASAAGTLTVVGRS